ncbi:hypothetical protein ABZT43_47090 [Streptomyces sp. NPDC005349]|uniref:hypothetical protein n=1 Tax=Streptomyces sp. NPDC005349 TaxID=3157037 RepID=UPI0033AEAA0C
MPDDAAAVVELREQLAVVVGALAQRDGALAELRVESAELRRHAGPRSSWET